MRTVALLLTATLLLAGCSGDEEDGEKLVVLAASSLAEVAPELDAGATVVLGGSNDLAAQLRDGADADVLLSASAGPVEELRERGLVEAPEVFAANRLVIVVPADNPAGIEHVQDLARSGVKLVLGAPGVPIGDYAREALAGTDAVAQVVSLEEDVKGVLGKVRLGEADAGIVYATDAKAAGADVLTVAIPAARQPQVRYYAALVSPPSDAGRAYVERLLGDEGRAVLQRAGFLPPP
jgi:molybdate transport system substrate-binding protein